jgi:hypothetical protein
LRNNDDGGVWLIPCEVCKKGIEDAKSVVCRVCAGCQKENKRKANTRYREEHTRGVCAFCGKLVLVADKHEGLVYCSVCGSDGSKRKVKYKRKRTISSC